MIFFVVFVFSAVIIGIGVMLAPVLPTTQPRIGLASTIALALTILSGILWTTFVGWDTLIIDYVLFGLVSVVILGGTMIQAHDEASSDDESSSTQWMSGKDFLFFLVVSGICLLSMLFNLTQSNFENELASALQTGQTLDHLSQDFPQIMEFSVTGFYILSAYLSQQLQQDSVLVQSAVTTVLIFLGVLTSYDLGSEMKDTYLGRIFALIVLILLMIVSTFSAPMLLPILISFGALIFALRSYRHRHYLDIVGLIFLLFALFFI